MIVSAYINCLEPDSAEIAVDVDDSKEEDDATDAVVTEDDNSEEAKSDANDDTDDNDDDDNDSKEGIQPIPLFAHHFSWQILFRFKLNCFKLTSTRNMKGEISLSIW